MSTRPDFRQVNIQIANLKDLDELLQMMPKQTLHLREAAAAACLLRRKEQAVSRLATIPVEELKASKAGIRTALLTEAGYHTLYDLYQVSDASLCSIDGIGEKQAAAIRTIIDGFLQQMSERERIRLEAPGAASASTAAHSGDKGSGAQQEGSGECSLICALARLRLAEQICRDAQPLTESIHEFLPPVIERVRIRSRLRWLFSFAGTKEETLQALSELQNFLSGPDYERAERFAHLFLQAVETDEEQAARDYEQNSAAYYALLESLSGSRLAEELVYGSVPANLAAEISRTELDLMAFRGNLRGYQRFGSQYILHQKKVLLGDEMGLGKTIQAIAAMSHLHRQTPEYHFLVVCPASVMINWCREIEKFSEIHAELLHGSLLQSAFEKWKQGGGAAVTNYESLRHITDRIDEKMRLALLVIDEAHYIKNPEAQRTRYIHRLEDEAERILMMTGTPLENRVDEMCELIGFVRPDMVPEIRAYAGMRKAETFREMLSPVYLRRQADQVLEELPELIETEEWCAMTTVDRGAYAAEVQSGSFMAMRRVGFLQEDLETSAKAQRLRELCTQAAEEDKKIIVYSYFRETLRKVREYLEKSGSGVYEPASGGQAGSGISGTVSAGQDGEMGSAGLKVIGEITGSTPVMERQAVIDRFGQAVGGSILLCQVQAGGTGLNIQTASVVIFCEPQIKPSLERQAVARVYRMGQIRSVLVHHLLCPQTVDEAIRRILEEKEAEFALYADESAMADAEASLADKEWIKNVIEEERSRYLPAVRE